MSAEPLAGLPTRNPRAVPWYPAMPSGTCYDSSRVRAGGRLARH